MPKILSLEHCARITTWDDARRRLHGSRKHASRARLAFFIGVNVAVWMLVLAPILMR